MTPVSAGLKADLQLPLSAVDGEPIDTWPTLTVRQPWAWAIARAGKDIENRSRTTRYRGPILIHAAKAVPDYTEIDDLLALLELSAGDGAQALELEQFEAEAVYGAIVASAKVTDCVAASTSPWFCGPFGWVLMDVRPIARPIHRAGRLGIFHTAVLRNSIGRAPEELAP